jgi:hypothetical protein
VSDEKHFEERQQKDPLNDNSDARFSKGMIPTAILSDGSKNISGGIVSFHQSITYVK